MSEELQAHEPNPSWLLSSYGKQEVPITSYFVLFKTCPFRGDKEGTGDNTVEGSTAE